MPGDMVTALACADDVPALVELMAAFYAEAGFPLDRAWATRVFADLIASPERGAVWIVRAGEDAIGHAVLSVRFAMEFGGLIGYIDDLFVLPSHRRKGAAAAALDALLAECRRRGCLAVHVEVDPANEPANALYALYGLRRGSDSRQMLHARLT